MNPLATAKREGLNCAVGFWPYSLAAVAGYFLGSIPTGYLAGRAKGIDIRSAGSGNIGATNVFRVLGRRAGIVVLLVDALKGFAASWFLPRLISAWFSNHSDLRGNEYLAIAAGIGAILGHNYTCWLKFKGGKGVATTAGVLAALFPAAFLIVLGLWILVFVASGYVSLASITAAIALPVAVWLIGSSLRMLVVATFMGALATYKHKANIQRLLQGTENRFNRKKPEPDPVTE